MAAVNLISQISGFLAAFVDLVLHMGDDVL